MSTGKVDVDGMIEQGRDKLNDMADKSKEYVSAGREKLSDMADKGKDYVSSANSFLTDFIRDEPLIGIASAFAAGYVVARLLNQVSRR